MNRPFVLDAAFLAVERSTPAGGHPFVLFDLIKSSSIKLSAAADGIFRFRF